MLYDHVIGVNRNNVSIKWEQQQQRQQQKQKCSGASSSSCQHRALRRMEDSGVSDKRRGADSFAPCVEEEAGEDAGEKSRRRSWRRRRRRGSRKRRRS